MATRCATLNQVAFGPLPGPCVAEQNKDQPADDEQDDGSMKNEDEISERLVHDGLRL